jgi:hypothetical protein
MKLHMLLSFALLAAGVRPLCAEALKGPEVTHAVNDVRIADGARVSGPLKQRAQLADGATLLTGAQSRAELVFPDGSIARLGAETAAHSGRGSRDLVLDRGTLLLQVSNFRGGARVHTGSLTLSIGAATILVEHQPRSTLKVAVIEGDLRVAADGFLGDSIILKPGKMLIAKPDVRRIPDAVDIDLRTLARTSSLIDPTAFSGSSGVSVGPLPSMPRIERAIARQAALVKARKLYPTNLMILGSGTTVVIPAAGDPGPERPPGPVVRSTEGARVTLRGETGAGE